MVAQYILSVETIPGKLFPRSIHRGQWDRRKREISRIMRIKERFAFDKWLRKTNAKRHKRVWKNRNNFYK